MDEFFKERYLLWKQYWNSNWNIYSHSWGRLRNAEGLVSWESKATALATPFFKRAYKISHPPWLWVSWIDFPSFASWSKIWPNFSNKVFFSWSYEKVILTKNVRLTYYSSMKKKIRKVRMIFDIENSLWKSKIGTFWQTVTRWRLKIW